MKVAFGELLRTFTRVGLLSFGGPAGQIAVMHRILVEEKRWVSEARFLHALNYCMLLPGPEAQQLATYLGWLLHGWRGGLCAGLLFVLPGFLSILLLSVAYALWQQAPAVAALLFGLKAATLAVVLAAVVRIGRKALQNGVMVGIAAVAFLAIFLLRVPFPAIVVGAGLLGLLGGRLWPGRFQVLHGHDVADAGVGRAPVAATWGRALRTALLWLGIWLLPVAGLAAWLGSDHVLVTEAVFFSKTAVVTFGGAYAVLAYLAQQAVEVHGWLRPGEMLDGLGMAETTPGPLIQVVQFVGFLGAFRDPAPFSPLGAGLLASVVVTWVTFAPCFLWILVGAPWVERLRGHAVLNAGLSAITAAVVGVILNLALWFGLHVLFARVHEWEGAGVRVLWPEWGSIDLAATAVAALAGWLLLGRRWGLSRALLTAAGVGALWHPLLP